MAILVLAPVPVLAPIFNPDSDSDSTFFTLTVSDDSAFVLGFVMGFLSEIGTGTGTGIGMGPGTETGMGPGTETGMGPGTETGMGPRTETGMGSSGGRNRDNGVLLLTGEDNDTDTGAVLRIEFKTVPSFGIDGEIRVSLA